MKNKMVYKKESLSNVDISGRWTKEEHNLFVKGLELYGKSWKLIQRTVKTRSIVQIRTHAQKYFLKLEKTQQNIEEDRSHEHTKKRNMKVKVSPLLQPYLTALNTPSIHNNTNICSYSDAEKALHYFLSPPYGTMLPHSSITLQDESLVDIQNNTLTESTNIEQQRCVLSKEELAVPVWFLTGGSIESLLQTAELLGWDFHNTTGATVITDTNTNTNTVTRTEKAVL